MILRNLLIGTLFAGTASVASAADLSRPLVPVSPAVPVVTQQALDAVSGLNGKIEGAGGYEWGDKTFRDHAFGRLAGSVAMPLGHSFGVQLDVAGETARGEFGGAVGGHLFWRNPSFALLGVYADGYTTKAPKGDFNLGRVAAEGELYLDRVSLSAIAGVEYGNMIKTRGFIDAVASLYATDDLRVYAGWRNDFAGNQGRGGVEYQLPASTGWGNVALFAEGRVGEHGYAAGLGGVKVYFGQQKSLMRRHREDDPDTWSTQAGGAVAQAISGGQLVKKKKKPDEPTCTPPGDADRGTPPPCCTDKGARAC